jgi:hypothetical protein
VDIMQHGSVYANGEAVGCGLWPPLAYSMWTSCNMGSNDVRTIHFGPIIIIMLCCYDIAY